MLQTDKKYFTALQTRFLRRSVLDTIISVGIPFFSDPLYNANCHLYYSAKIKNNIDF